MSLCIESHQAFQYQSMKNWEGNGHVSHNEPDHIEELDETWKAFVADMGDIDQEIIESINESSSQSLHIPLGKVLEQNRDGESTISFFKQENEKQQDKAFIKEMNSHKRSLEIEKEPFASPNVKRIKDDKNEKESIFAQNGAPFYEREMDCASDKSSMSNFSSSSRRRGTWSNEENELLRTAVAKFGVPNWTKIATCVPGRSHRQCSAHWHKVLKTGLIKGSWTAEEDKLLEAIIFSFQQHDESISWALVSDHVPGRTPKQCRDRWMGSLDPDISRTPWTDAEDRVIWRAYQEKGNKWADISRLLKNRTWSQVRTRINTLEKMHSNRIHSLSRAHDNQTEENYFG